MIETYGYPQTAWEAAKQEAEAILNAVAADPNGIPVAYSELASKITAIRFAPDQSEFRHFLGQLSTDSDAAGRGMITALVVYKDRSKRSPGPGFFKLAKRLGRDISDPDACWIAEVKRVRAAAPRILPTG